MSPYPSNAHTLYRNESFCSSTRPTRGGFRRYSAQDPAPPLLTGLTTDVHCRPTPRVPLPVPLLLIA